MHAAKVKRPRVKIAPSNGKRRSFRALKAFGIWSVRHDVKEAVEFVKQLRKRMEHGNNE